MGIGTIFKANKALKLQRNGNAAEAMRLYEECFAEGLKDARFVLPYAALLVRDGQYQKAKDFLVKNQKAPGMTPEQRINLIVDYAACCFRLGDVAKGISKLEELDRKGHTGLIYQTLGYLYVEMYDRSRREEFLVREADRQVKEAEERAARRAAMEARAEEEDDSPWPVVVQEAEDEAPPPPPEELWEAGVRKALEYNQEAVEYDDEDSICLDNLAQVYYRVLDRKDEAKPWFEKALAVKETQIDTLYFLSRYDLENGDRDTALARLEKALEGRFSALNYCSREMIQAEINTLKGAR